MASPPPAASPARNGRRARAALPAAAALSLAAASALVSCAIISRPPPRPFDVPEESLLIPDLPFYPDDTRLCGPASLAAVMNYMGYPVTLEEVEAGVQRWEIKGSIGPDLVLWARSRGARARFFAAEPEELLGFVERRTPVVVQVDEGIGPVIMGHFMVVAGYSPDGIVVNSGTVRQEIRPWAKFLTQWYRMGNFAIEVGGREAAAPAPAEGEPAPGGGGAN